MMGMGRLNSYINGHINPRFPMDRKESDRIAAMFATDAIVDENGIVRWESVNRIPPTDILEFWHFLRKPFNYESTLAEYNKETRESIAAYKRSMENYQPSAEELYEMQAAFGKGTTVVNAITGRKIQL